MFREQFKKTPSFLTTIRWSIGLGVNKSNRGSKFQPNQSYIPIKKKFFFFFLFLGSLFTKTFVNYSLLVLSLIGFLPILVVFFSSTFIHSLLVLALIGFLPVFWLLLFIHSFTCSFPYWLSANFGCFFSSTFIHSLLVLSLIGFLPILIVFLSSTFIHSLGV